MKAEKITRSSNSNLALAFISLGRARRRDITIFYAFCRVIDDIADGNDSAEEKARQLDRWRAWLREAPHDQPELAIDLRNVMMRHRIPPAMLDEIIDGVEMDLSISRYATWEELRVYCHRVASAVGLASIEIFGYRNSQCRQYAIELGLALQVTNIIRDVGKDLKDGRIYLPQEDLSRFSYEEGDLRARRYDDRFVRLMQFEAARAWELFRRASEWLPPEDRRSMVAAEGMRAIYSALLRRMERDNFRVFQTQYRLSKIEKLGRMAGQVLQFR